MRCNALHCIVLIPRIKRVRVLYCIFCDEKKKVENPYFLQYGTNKHKAYNGKMLIMHVPLALEKGKHFKSSKGSESYFRIRP